MVLHCKVQNRAISAEENLRHFVLTGKLLDNRLTIKQIVAIRCASDDQIVDLARQAAEQSMAPDAIKRAVTKFISLMKMKGGYVKSLDIE